ncbi:MAG: hypothetical protein ACON5K_11525 [Bacteroidia bacterium]
MSMLRHFADRWYCSTYGYLNSMGNPNWSLIVGNEYVSEGYVKHPNKPIVLKEHIVPLKVIGNLLLNSPACAIDNLAIDELLRKYLKFATILKEEDKLLLKSDMPPEFYDPKHVDYDQIFLRYDKAKIKLFHSKDNR